MDVSEYFFLCKISISDYFEISVRYTYKHSAVILLLYSITAFAVHILPLF